MERIEAKVRAADQPKPVGGSVASWRPALTNDQHARAARIATGVAAGLIAGLVASFAMDRFQALAQPASAGGGEPATEQAADAVATIVAGAPLSEESKPMAGQLVHYGLGAVLGVAYGIAAEFRREVAAGGGTAFAAGTWALLDEAAVPAAGWGNPPWVSPPASQAFGFASHLVFGITAELTRRAASRAIAGPSRGDDPALLHPASQRRRAGKHVNRKENPRD